MNIRFKRGLLPFLWLAVVLTWSVASARPFTASDLVTLREIGTIAVSPDGRWMAWDQRETDLAANQTRTRIWLLDLEHPGEPRPLFPDDDYNVHHPRFGAEGQWIYFESDVTGVDQLWRTPTTETAAEQVSDFDGGPGEVFNCLDRRLLQPH